MGSLYQRGSVWWLKYRQNGRVMRESSGSEKKTVAQRMLDARQGDVVRGVPIAPKMGRITFDEAAEDVTNEYRTNGRRTLAHAERRITKHLRPVFQGQRLTDIPTSKLVAFTADRQQAGASNAEINRELALVKRMFSLAVKYGKLYHKPHIPMLAEHNTRQGFFERDAFDAVRAHLPAALRPVVTFAYLTGWRIPSEVLTLEWRQVDLDAGVVRLEPGTTKNDRGREFPFGGLPELAEVLRAQAVERDRLAREGVIVRHVFHRQGKPIADYRDAWKAACKAAGVPGRVPHDLRRTAVRNLVRAGVSEHVAMTLTGHKTRSVFDRYDIVSGTDTREAVKKLAGTNPGTVTRIATVRRLGGRP